jgi:hypothetical protein
MQKWYSIFRVVFLCFFLGAFSLVSMQAQNGYVSGFDESTEQEYVYEVDLVNSEYVYFGFFGGDAYFFSDDTPNGSYLYYPSGNIYDSSNGTYIPSGLYTLAINIATGDYEFISGGNPCDNPMDTINVQISSYSSPFSLCSGVSLYANFSLNGQSTNSYLGLNIQWYSNGNLIPGATGENLYLNSSNEETRVIQLVATCPVNNQSIVSNEITIPPCYNDFSPPLNYLLIQNVTTMGNIPGQSIQVQFDLDWGNTWRDNVNWDATWIFMKYKDSQGVWQHAKVSPSGYDHGQGTINLIEPAADQTGAFVRLGAQGIGDFSVDGMQLRWNYGADGLASVSGLEVRVFAVEMVYTPQGDYSMTVGSAAPGNKIPVINSRLTPIISADGNPSVRIKGNAGLDLNADGTVENTTYPTGYYPFYVFKYEMSEQQYADFLNCLTPTQRGTLGVAGSTITQTAGQYFASLPNQVCAGANANRVLAYADWAGLRPMSYLEYQKALNGPKASNPNGQMYGIKNLGGSLSEPYVRLSSSQFNRTNHGNGVLPSTGVNDVNGWSAADMGTISGSSAGFRLCRTAE